MAAGVYFYFPAFGWGLSLRREADAAEGDCVIRFPRLRAGTFIEAQHEKEEAEECRDISPLSGGGLSLRQNHHLLVDRSGHNFPAFGWGLSLRTHTFNKSGAYYEMFSPGGGAFIEAIKPLSRWAMFRHFSAFGRRLSLRPREHCARHGAGSRLLHLWVGTFIEAHTGAACG